MEHNRSTTKDSKNYTVERNSKKRMEYKFTIKELPDEEKPRERLIGFGPSALSNAELLAIILRIGNPGESVVDLAKKLHKEHDIKSLSPNTLRG